MQKVVTFSDEEYRQIVNTVDEMKVSVWDLASSDDRRMMFTYIDALTIFLGMEEE